MKTEEKPRLYTLKELREGCGGGWYECWLMESDAEPETKELQPCGWCLGHIILEYGSNGPIIEDWYNVKYGYRIWSGKPTDEEREAEPWNGQI